MGVVYSTLPKPKGNLSVSYRKSDYGGSSITVNIDVGPVIFLSSTKMRFYATTTYSSTLAFGVRWFKCNIKVNCQDGSSITSNNYTSDYSDPYTFYGEITTTSPITSITMGERGIESFFADSTGLTKAVPAISGTFEQTIPVVQASSPYIVVKSHKLTQILLPAAPTKGQWFRIKCGVNCMAYIHTLGIPVDNGTSATVFNSFGPPAHGSVMENMQAPASSYASHGFTMNTLDSCMILYNGEQWIVQEYRNGGPNIDYSGITGNGKIYSYWNTVPLTDSSRINLLASSPEVTICNMSSGSRSVQLPDPSTFIGVKYILAALTGAGQTLSIVAPYNTSTQKYMFEEANENPYGTGITWTGITPWQFQNLEDGNGKYGNCLTFTAKTGNQIAVTLFSDGAWWWILNAHIGQYAYTNTQNIAGKVALTDVVICINSETYTGATLPVITGAGAQPRYVKLLRPNNSTPAYASPVSTSVKLAGTTDTTSMVYNPYLDNTALSFIGYQKADGTTEYFTTGAFIGY